LDRVLIGTKSGRFGVSLISLKLSFLSQANRPTDACGQQTTHAGGNGQATKYEAIAIAIVNNPDTHQGEFDVSYAVVFKALNEYVNVSKTLTLKRERADALPLLSPIPEGRPWDWAKGEPLVLSGCNGTYPEHS
jgi:hypothetical protein